MNDSGMIMCNSAVLKLFGRLQSGIGRTCRRSISFAGHAIDAHPRPTKIRVNSIEGRLLRDAVTYLAEARASACTDG